MKIYFDLYILEVENSKDPEYKMKNYRDIIKTIMLDTAEYYKEQNKEVITEYMKKDFSEKKKITLDNLSKDLGSLELSDNQLSDLTTFIVEQIEELKTIYKEKNKDKKYNDVLVFVSKIPNRLKDLFKDY